MDQRVQFSVIKKLDELTALLPEIGQLADSNKDALGFWSPAALQEAVSRKSLIQNYPA